MAQQDTTGADREPRPAEVAARLRLGVMRLSRRLRQHAPGNISQSQLSVLATLVRGGAMPLGDLAAAERVQPPTITRIVDALASAGLVSRRQGTEDRRVVHVEATREGRALVEAVRRRRDTYLAQRLNALDADELALLARAAELLERLCEDPQR
jgi:DNA-binding MarR family transcriptional regulator